MSRREGMMFLILNLLLLSALLTGGLFHGGGIPLHDHSNAQNGGALGTGVVTSIMLAASVPIVFSTATLLIDTGSCPAGYTELTALRGRYPVGVPSGGTMAATVGTPLTNSENRPAGAHTHSVLGTTQGIGGLTNAITQASTNNDQNSSTDNGGLVAGTNAPFYQVMFCKKS